MSEDFELMIHLYNLGFNGRYIVYPDCEFQEGITRTFDEEAGRHRKFALGAHELMFNPFNSWFGRGIFSPLFRIFLGSDIPSYYKIFLTSYLFSYASGGCYIFVFTVAAVARLLDQQDKFKFLFTFSSAGVLALSVVVSVQICLFFSPGQQDAFSFSRVYFILLLGVLRDRLHVFFDCNGTHVSGQQEPTISRVPRGRHLLSCLQDDPILYDVSNDILFSHGQLFLPWWS